MRSALWVVMFTLLVASCGDHPPSSSVSVAGVSVVRGGVRVAGAEPSPSQRLGRDGVVETGPDGRARTRFDDGAVALLDGSTRLVAHTPSLAEVTQGRAFFDAPAGQPFVVRTAFGELRFVDAQLAITVASTQVRVDVLRGSVSHRKDQRRGVVESGRRLTLSAAEPRVEPQALWEDWTGGLASPGPRDPREAAAVGVLEGRRPGDVGEARWPLVVRNLAVHVRVVGDLAITEVEQTFFNPASATLEGLYRIRVPEGAVLHRFAVDRNGRMVDGYVREKRAAAAAYQAQVYEGSTLDPALLEWDAPGVYRARIHPIVAGESRRIAIRYSEWLSRPKAGAPRVYRFPMGAGPSAPEIESISIDVDLAGTTLSSVRASHEARLDARSVELRRNDFRPRTDFVVEIEGGDEALTAFRAHHGAPLRDPHAPTPVGEESDYFYVPLVIAPPTDVAPVTPTDLVVVADLSAGTDRSRLELGRSVVEALAAQLREGDRITIVGGDVTLRSLGASDALGPVSRERVRGLLDALARAPAGGASDLGAMLSEAAGLLDPARNGAVIYVGDGAPTVGELGAGPLLERLSRLPHPLRVFGVAVGTDANADLLASVARGSGSVMRVTTTSEAADVALDLVARATRPVLSRVAVDLGTGIDRVYPRDASSVDVGVPLGVVGRVRGALPTRVKVTGTYAGHAFERSLPVRVVEVDDGGDLRLRWATARLERLLLDGARRAEVVDLGVRSGVITPFTSLYVPSAQELASLGTAGHALVRTAALDAAPRLRVDSNPVTEVLSWAIAPVAALYGCSSEKSAAPPPTATAPPPPGSGSAPSFASQEAQQAGHADRQDQAPDEQMARTRAVAQAMEAEARNAPAAPAAAPMPSPEPSAAQPQDNPYGDTANDNEAPSGEADNRRVAGGDAMDAIGSLLGAEIGENGGAGGLGLRGSGAAGGGTGQGTYGMGGDLGTLGRGGGGGSGSGYGRGSGGLGDRGPSRPVVRPAGSASVQGGLTADQIRRVIQRNISQVQHCYEQGLARNPSMAGRITVAFLISPGGSVAGSSVADNSLGDSVVGTCVSGAVRRWAFPQPDPPGPVSVRFPFNLSQSGGDAVPAGRPVAGRAPGIHGADFGGGGVDVAFGYVVSHTARTCSDAAGLLLESRAGLWRERLSRAYGGYDWARLYESAVAACEAPTTRDRRKFLDLVLDRAGSVQAMLEAYGQFASPSARTYLRRTILARVRTPDELRAARVTFGAATVDAALLATTLAGATDDAGRIAALERLLLRFEGDLDLSMQLLDLYERAARRDEAKQLALVLRANPLTDAGMRTRIGEMFLRLGDEPEARRAFSEIVEFAPNDELARRRLGDLYRAHGWYDDAYRQYTTLSELRPDDATVLLLLAQAAAGAGRIDEALRLEQRLAETAPPGGAEGLARVAILWSSVRLAELRSAARTAGDAEKLRNYQSAMRRGGVLREAGQLRATLVWSHPDADLSLRAAHPGLGLSRPTDLSPELGLEAFDVREREPGTYRLEVRRGDRDSLTRVEAKLVVVFREGAADEQVVILPLRFERGASSRAFVIEGDAVRDVPVAGGAR